MKLERAKGTRDFAPEEAMLRNKTIDTVKSVFELYGFAPLETPTIERFDIMTVKGGLGEESDAFNEIFDLTDNGDRKLGLRFELTFPLARFIGMNPTIKMPFKRYQIGNCFRDGPLKAGRYREFIQCDADVIGSDSLLTEAELLAMTADVFKKLNIDIVIQVNNRKILYNFMEKAGIDESEWNSCIISIDKLDKIGEKGVRAELEEKIKISQIDDLLKVISIKGTNEDKLKALPDSDGKNEMEELLLYLKQFNCEVDFNPILARGLGYYTGTIYEVFAIDKSVVSGSLMGGGRWDNLIGQYINKEFPAVGISFGIEPIMEIIKTRGMLEKTPLKIYLVPINTVNETIKVAQELRAQGINVGMDLQGRKLAKNLDYANVNNIPYVGIIGENELKEGTIQLKNMKTGEQDTIDLKDVSKSLQ